MLSIMNPKMKLPIGGGNFFLYKRSICAVVASVLVLIFVVLDEKVEKNGKIDIVSKILN